MENIFYATLALHIAGKPISKENIRAVLKAAGAPVNEPALEAMAAFVEFTYSINSFVVYRLELLESYGHYLTTAPASTGGPSNHVTGKYRYLVALPTHSFAQASIP